MKTYTFEKLTVKKADSRLEMGQIAAKDCAETLRKLLSEKETVSMIFAAAPSQNETLAALMKEEGIDWTRVIAFHMDEYVGLANDHPQSFGTYLREHVFAHLPFKAINYLNGAAADPAAECARYGKLLADNPVDIVCLGIGENGHIAFNDPGVADFNDPAPVKLAELDQVCRMQQVHDGCFATIDDVPTHAFTLTIPSLTNAKHLFCSVPASTKAEAVYRTCYEEITENCPATIMRKHAHAVMYVDPDSGVKLA
nr:glucosamine-6-phosphate deaminase [Clostridia bacterium]